MYVSFQQKVVVAVIGVCFAAFLLVFFAWWLALLGLFAMIPFFYKVLTA